MHPIKLLKKVNYWLLFFVMFGRSFFRHHYNFPEHRGHPREGIFAMSAKVDNVSSVIDI